jgi:hypothetical protein
MKQWWDGLYMLGLVLACMYGGQVLDVHGSTVQGTAVQISGLDDLNATVDNQARKGFGKVLAVVGAIGSLMLIPAGRTGLGLTGAGSCLAMGFIPGIISTGFDSAPAATVGCMSETVATAWWAPATLALYPGLLALRILQDPVFVVSIALALGIAKLRRDARLSPAR